ncbi:hypothetical protein DQ04_00741050 [Trypanosoma grayi]|uniref:hypothetical protein n=1 Tax=Trypanosoma grayi TaxID=71804 RepID=UPI0004F41A75|nr:hypothetical protein DQ04_00741050 [Trypanosoma grayi]KEG13861.1 hypothetical protein DQ04_00741050 [Trypanosoma grayi]
MVVLMQATLAVKRVKKSSCDHLYQVCRRFFLSLSPPRHRWWIWLLLFVTVSEMRSPVVHGVHAEPSQFTIVTIAIVWHCSTTAMRTCAEADGAQRCGFSYPLFSFYTLIYFNESSCKGKGAAVLVAAAKLPLTTRTVVSCISITCS